MDMLSMYRAVSQLISDNIVTNGKFILKIFESASNVIRTGRYQDAPRSWSAHYKERDSETY